MDGVLRAFSAETKGFQLKNAIAQILFFSVVLHVGFKPFVLNIL